MNSILISLIQTKNRKLNLKVEDFTNFPYYVVTMFGEKALNYLQTLDDKLLNQYSLELVRRGEMLFTHAEKYNKQIELEGIIYF
jgi:hypothetical protein